jgi:hypothetical protein
MKSKSWIVLMAFAFVAAGGLAGLTTSWAQDANQQLQSNTAESSGSVDSARAAAESDLWLRRERGMGRGMGGPAADPRIGAMQEITAAAAAFRDAANDEAKSAARKKLADLLDKYFDADMKARAAELTKVEERVKKLRTLFDTRASKKQEIIDLQVKVLENEADGLGFFNNVSNLPPTAGPNVSWSNATFGPQDARYNPYDAEPSQPQPQLTPTRARTSPGLSR